MARLALLLGILLGTIACGGDDAPRCNVPPSRGCDELLSELGPGERIYVEVTLTATDAASRAAFDRALWQNDPGASITHRGRWPTGDATLNLDGLRYVCTATSVLYVGTPELLCPL